MKHLVVFAHPYSKSFGKGIVDMIEKEVSNNKSEIRIRDLYELGFDPILKGSDLLNLQSGNYADDIKVEQEHIKWADIITFVYPVWWAGLPAVLKGYADRVLANGFAFTYEASGPVGLLKGKKAILFSTTGFPSDMYAQIGMHKSMQQTTDEAIFEFCGIEVIKHVFFGAVPSSTEEELKQYLGEVREVIKANC
ncbi:NAD(P)H-dependent oxidoreductase [Clostridium estertheticum]|uniref:NAD(P)H-dependent oxidoreductase n=1 Tax=Clostridium estertheticum TaxID=238834 RepID=UPI001C0E5436|nr:NAD(P)H-dependent oxidoreductase [Clostridium estertheticum]MBU3178376.1 NAD(P)H-dependent oxidoreductase [Clostridium estertheticum]